MHRVIILSLMIMVGCGQAQEAEPRQTAKRVDGPFQEIFPTSPESDRITVSIETSGGDEMDVDIFRWYQDTSSISWTMTDLFSGLSFEWHASLVNGTLQKGSLTLNCTLEQLDDASISIYRYTCDHPWIEQVDIIF